MDIISTNKEEYGRQGKCNLSSGVTEFWIEEGFTSIGGSDGSTDSSLNQDEYDQTETFFVKGAGQKAYDLKIEHFDDMIQDNSFQSSWAGLDSILIDEEFLYLEDEEADKIYAQLK